MERAANLKPKPYESSKREQTLLVVIIILFHVVGIIGLAVPVLRPLFLMIVPWHIVLMLVLIFISHKPMSEGFLLFALIIFVTGFAGEWIGVHKSWIFGDYAYGKTLGWQLFNIPLTIGINWFLLIYSTGVLMQRLRVRSIFARVAAGALILVSLDLLIEPVAIKFDYWHWMNNIIPFNNYAGWFIVSAIMLFVFEKFNFKKQGVVGPVLLITQFVFFGLLHLI